MRNFLSSFEAIFTLTQCFFGRLAFGDIDASTHPFPNFSSFIKKRSAADQEIPVNTVMSAYTIFGLIVASILDRILPNFKSTIKIIRVQSFGPIRALNFFICLSGEFSPYRQI